MSGCKAVGGGCKGGWGGGEALAAAKRLEGPATDRIPWSETDRHHEGGRGITPSPPPPPRALQVRPRLARPPLCTSPSSRALTGHPLPSSCPPSQRL